jgi:SAM-dependent methyltransferase
MPLPFLKAAHKAGILSQYKIPSGRIDFGHLRQTQPLSLCFGFDREGGPVDRYYIDQFLTKSAPAIKGRVLEIEDNEYTLRYGQKQDLKSEILHVYAGNPKATIIGDLSDAPQIPDNSFDCIILTQTLHLIYNFEAAIATCYRILKEGGSLLLTVPGITPIDHGEWKNIWYWSFTEASIKKLSYTYFTPAKSEITTYGNVLAATAFLYGLGLKDIKEEELEYRDPHYPVIVAAKLTK